MGSLPFRMRKPQLYLVAHPGLGVGGLSTYLELYRYRAYQDQVTAAVWEQMRNNQWQKACKTDVVVDSVTPTYPPDHPLAKLKRT